MKTYTENVTMVLFIGLLFDIIRAFSTGQAGYVYSAGSAVMCFILGGILLWVEKKLK